MIASITFDVEHDCPPMLSSTRGMEEGLPRILDLLAARKIHATFFSTGVMAARYPRLARRIVDEGHELGCHSYNHERLDKLPPWLARRAVEKATRILRRFGEVVSFRAPNLKLPGYMAGFLRSLGYIYDSSPARYKPPFPRRVWVEEGLVRIPASTTSSVLRLPWKLQERIHARLRSPVVYFSHPWEYVDMSQAPIRWDCKFNTGRTALSLLDRLIVYLESRGTRIVPIRSIVKVK